MERRDQPDQRNEAQEQAEAARLRQSRIRDWNRPRSDSSTPSAQATAEQSQRGNGQPDLSRGDEPELTSGVPDRNAGVPEVTTESGRVADTGSPNRPRRDGLPQVATPRDGPAAERGAERPESVRGAERPAAWDQREAARDALTPAERAERARIVHPADGIGFAYGDSRVADSDVRRWYDGLSRQERQSLHSGGTEVRIVAFASSPGSDSENWVLSKDRAAALKDALVRVYHLDPSRVVALGLGEQLSGRDHLGHGVDFAEDRVAVVRLAPRRELRGDVGFEGDATRLPVGELNRWYDALSPEEQEALRAPDTRITVWATGSSQALSEARAGSVADGLAARSGFDRSRIVAFGIGDQLARQRPSEEERGDAVDQDTAYIVIGRRDATGEEAIRDAQPGSPGGSRDRTVDATLDLVAGATNAADAVCVGWFDAAKEEFGSDRGAVIARGMRIALAEFRANSREGQNPHVARGEPYSTTDLLALTLAVLRADRYAFLAAAGSEQDLRTGVDEMVGVLNPVLAMARSAGERRQVLRTFVDRANRLLGAAQ